MKKCLCLTLLLTILLSAFAVLPSLAKGATILSEDFNKVSVGALPAGYEKIAANVAEVMPEPGKPDNKVLHINKTNADLAAPDDMAQVTITIPEQTKTFVVETDIFLVSGTFWIVGNKDNSFPYGPALTATTAASTYNGADIVNLGYDFTKNKWHKLVMEINPADSTALIIIDGNLLTKAPTKFRNTSLKSINKIIFRSPSQKQLGDFYIDNLLIYEGEADKSGFEIIDNKPIVPFRALTEKEMTLYQNPVMKEFFVSTNGNDNNDGTETAPFKTVEKAKSAAKLIRSDMKGDIIVSIMPGEYLVEKPIEFGYSDSGTNGFNIIYRAKDGIGTVKFLGAKKLTNWSHVSGGIWKTTVTENFYTLYEKEERAIKARFPNKEFNPEFYTSKAPYLLTTDAVRTNFETIKYNTEDLKDITFSDITDANIVIWPWNQCDWQMWVNPIISVDKTTGTIVPTFTDKAIPFGENARYYIEGMYELLDVEGEFHLDTKTKTLYYFTKYGDPNTETEVYAPMVRTIFSLKGPAASNLCENIAFDGLSLEKTDFVRGMRGWFEVNPQEAITGTIYMENAQNIKITNCKIKNSGITGVFIYGRSGQNLIENCLFENIGNSGIIMRGLAAGETMMYNVIKNVLIHDIGETSIDCSGINLFYGQENLITNVEVYNSPRYGVSIRGGAGSFQWFTIPADINNDKYSGRSRNNKIQNLKLYETNQDSGDTASLHAAGITFEVKPRNINSYENIYIDEIFAHPSMKDALPNGIYLDYQNFGQKFKNIKVGNQNGYIDKTLPDIKYKYFNSYSQLRYNESGDGEYDNCSWYPGFDDSKMDYENMGITKVFPREYLPESDKVKESVILQEGSAKAYVKGEEKSIDAERPAVMPVNINDRVLVPLRFIAESFGAKVSYDENAKTAHVDYNGIIISLPEDSNKITVNGTEKILDVPAKTLNDRIFVPIRAVSESLNKEVFYDNGLIALSDAKGLFNSGKDRIAIDILGQKLLMGYNPAFFNNETVLTSGLRDFSEEITINNSGEGLMIRSGGAENNSFVSLMYQEGAGVRLLERADKYSIPKYTDLGITDLPVKFKFSSSTQVIKAFVNDTEVIQKAYDWIKPVIGSYGSTKKIDRPALIIGDYKIKNGEIAGIELDAYNDELEVGMQKLIKTNLVSTTGEKYDITEENPKFTSSNPSVIEISGASFTAKSQGEATITASININGKEYTSSIDYKCVTFKSVLINETFDKSIFDASKWTFTTDGLEGSYVKINDEGKLEVNCKNSVTPHMASRKFDNFDGIVTIEFDFKANFDMTPGAKTGAMLAYFLGNANTFCVSTFAFPGKFGYYTDGKIVEFGNCQNNTDYKIKIVVDVQKSLMDFYVNGNLELENAALRSRTTALAGIQIGGTANAANTVLWWDNIKVTKEKAGS